MESISILKAVNTEHSSNGDRMKIRKKTGYTAWSVFPDDTTYFKPAERDFMFNYRVENLKELIEVLKDEGVQIVGEMEEYPYGKFGWIMDPDGNKIELWEPVDEDAL